MQQNIELERCIDFLVRMIDKYGDEVLRELEEEKQNLFKAVNIWKYHLFASGMKLTNFFHTCCHFFMNGMLNWNRIVVSCMYMVKIVVPDWEHILEKKSGFFSVKFT